MGRFIVLDFMICCETVIVKAVWYLHQDWQVEQSPKINKYIYVYIVDMYLYI